MPGGLEQDLKIVAVRPGDRDPAGDLPRQADGGGLQMGPHIAVAIFQDAPGEDPRREIQALHDQDAPAR